MAPNTVPLGTGIRIGECLALTWDDLDFDNRTVGVNRTLTYRPEPENGCVVHISTPKMEAGKRTLPIIDEVYEAFLEEYQIQSCLSFNVNEIDGFSGFMFSTGDSLDFCLFADICNKIYRDMIREDDAGLFSSCYILMPTKLVKNY
ncbi:MAG: tyrosine-type recombinase/integrase [Mobilitalea sp.]